MEQIQTTYKNDIFVSWEEKSIPFNQVTFSSHNAYEIYILLEGERRAYVGDKVYGTCGGDALMLRSNVPHRSEGNTPYRGICIQFTESRLDAYYTAAAKKKLLSCFSEDVISLDKNTLSEMQLLLYHMTAEPENKALYLAAVLALFRRVVGQDGGESGQKKAISAIDTRSIEEYLLEQAAQITRLDEVAAHFCITKEYLCTLFKKQTGMTVVTYLNNVRIQKACRLLETTDEPVENISVMCGFQSPVYFYRLFKKMMNHTPAKYRKLVWESHRESRKGSKQ